MATTTSAEKTAEFAKLFDLFEMLATRRSRMAATGCASDDTHAIPIPADLEPVFRSLATVVPPREPLSGRDRRNTMAALGRTTYPDSDSDSVSDVESVAKFPLGKTYTFTFKMMIHKLYQVDEWAQKVRDVLKRSQNEYKPLAEREEVKKVEPAVVARVAVGDGRVHFKTEVTVGGKKTMPLVQGRARSQSIAVSGRVCASARITSPTPPTIIQDDARAVKKRCIGRRKSVSGPLPPTTSVGEGWIYDAAVSSTEIRERVPFRAETTVSFAPIPRPRPRYQSLQTGSRKMGFGPRRIVSVITTKEVAGVESAPRTSTKRRLSE
ncbi:hypothetical protein C8F04DRAFT_1366581 [Mycena alexandri]|uniref:Uncharacterized protein n=1 Tax=Mycena alexandri TaxID=1745969 RepID=A0AAD6TDY7_9AGAR|nr:hypothetical protein C8F04DRAFT_1366581 [Mycena alexandri]